VRSYWRHDNGGWSRVWVTEREPATRPTERWRGRGQWTTWRYATVESDLGALEFDCGVQEFDFATMEMREGGGFFWQADEWPRGLSQPDQGPWRFRYDSEQTPEDRHRMLTVTVPTWMVALAAAAPGACAVRWMRRKRRGTSGRCTSCGYDLRATPGRCPECGTACDGAVA
jgi:hypothetical protein